MIRTITSLSAISVVAAIGFTLAVASPSHTSAAYMAELEQQLQKFVAGKDARIGIAVIIDGEDTVQINGSKEFPMLSVYKFPQALAVADYCGKHAIAFSDTLRISAAEIKENTWSPMRERYGVRDLELPLSELLESALTQSDNNACDILFRLIGGPQVADSLMKEMGASEITIASTEDEMHRDPFLCYLNRSTPLEMARLFDRFNIEMKQSSPELSFIAEMLEKCSTGTDRLALPLQKTDAVLGHKTGTGDLNSQGRIIAVNDCGYVNLPSGHRYAVAVFIADSAYDMATTAALIASISEIIYRFIASGQP